MTDDEEEENHHRHEAQEGGAQLVDQLIDVLLVEAHMHRADTVDSLVDGHGHVVDNFFARARQLDAVIVVGADRVGVGQLGWKIVDEGVRQNLVLFVQDEDIAHQFPARSQTGVEDQTGQLGDVLGEQIAPAAFGDAVADAQPPQLEFRGQRGDENPAREQGDQDTDQQNHSRHREENLVFQAGVLDSVNH